MVPGGQGGGEGEGGSSVKFLVLVVGGTACFSLRLRIQEK